LITLGEYGRIEWKKRKGDDIMETTAFEKVTIQVSGMSCNHCVSSVEGSIGKLNGVSSVEVDLSSGTVEVTFDKNILSIKTIKEEIEEQGYDVV
jgi:copper chaperone